MRVDEDGPKEGGKVQPEPAEEFFYADEAFVRREKAKAQEIRRSQWWKNRRSSGICHYCGRKFPPAALTMDHLIPISRGGRSVHGNLVPCCKECNNRKRYLLPMEWQEYLDRLAQGKTAEPPNANEENRNGHD